MEEEKSVQSISSLMDKAILDSRRVFFCDVVDNKSAKKAIKELWYLESIAPGKPILFIINSPGGSVDAGFAVWDQIKMISSPVTTLVTGLAASMGSVLALCAEKGRRFATEHARFMIHQPSIGNVITGQATDLEIQAKEIIKTKNSLIDLYMSHTGKSREEVANALDRDSWMNASEALSFGLIDGIVSSFSSLN